MAGISTMESAKARKALNRFLERWGIDAVKTMTLEEYNSVGSKDSFCYWLEHESEVLGLIGGTPSNKFGIWQIKNAIQGASDDFLDDGNYKWYKKYGNNADSAFNTVKALLITIIESAKNDDFQKIDGIDYFSLAKWKVAFIYSNNQLIPVYKKNTVRQIAKNLEFVNYSIARISALHKYIVEQKEDDEDFFDFASRQYWVAVKNQERNYYIIGSKYGDGNGNNVVDISEKLYTQNVIATGFFWDENLTHLYGKSRSAISKWVDKNLKSKYPDKFESAKRTLSFFLGIKAGDIIAVKSHGQYGNLTIIAYAEVQEVEGNIYEHKPDNLGHCINVKFLEQELYKNVKLSYGQTIHQIVPGLKEGHFNKIFGSYAVLENVEIEESETDDDFELSESRINEKQTKSGKRDVSYSTTVKNIHNKIQSAFAKHLLKEYPKEIIRTEYKFIDILRQNKNELYYYEVKPYNTAYNCIRSAIGQLLDYYHSNPHSKKRIHLIVVGSAIITDSDKKFIDFIKESLSISFDYISFNKY
jgi:hypothetical protein